MGSWDDPSKEVRSPPTHLLKDIVALMTRLCTLITHLALITLENAHDGDVVHIYELSHSRRRPMLPPSRRATHNANKGETLLNEWLQRLLHRLEEVLQITPRVL